MADFNIDELYKEAEKTSDDFDINALYKEAEKEEPLDIESLYKKAETSETVPLPTPTVMPSPEMVPLPETPGRSALGAKIPEADFEALAKEYDVPVEKVKAIAAFRGSPRQVEDMVANGFPVQEALSGQQKNLVSAAQQLGGPDKLLESPSGAFVSKLNEVFNSIFAGGDEGEALTGGLSQEQLANIIQKTTRLGDFLSATFSSPKDRALETAVDKKLDEYEGWISKYALPTAGVIATAPLIPMPKIAALGKVGAVAESGLAKTLLKFGVDETKAATLAAKSVSLAADTTYNAAQGAAIGAWLAPRGTTWDEALEGGAAGAIAGVAGRGIGYIMGKGLGKAFDSRLATTQVAKLKETAVDVIDARKDQEIKMFSDYMESDLKNTSIKELEEYAKILSPDGKLMRGAIREASAEARKFHPDSKWEKFALLPDYRREEFLAPVLRSRVREKLFDEAAVFADEYLPVIVKTTEGRINLVKFMADLARSNTDDFIDIVASHSWIPRPVVGKASEMAMRSTGGLRAAKRYLKDWAADTVFVRNNTNGSKAKMIDIFREAKTLLGESEEKFNNQWLAYRTGRLIGDQLEDLAAQGKLGMGQKATMKKWAYYFDPDHLVIDDIDRRYGYGRLGELAMSLNRKENLFLQKRPEMQKQAMELFGDDYMAARRDIGFEDELFARFHEAASPAEKERIVEGFIADMSSEKKAYVHGKFFELSKQHKEMTDYFLKEAEGLGFKLKQLDNYLSRKFVPPEVAIPRMLSRAEELEKAGLNKKNFITRFKSDKKVKELCDSLEIVTGSPDIRNYEHYMKALSSLDDPSQLPMMARALSPTASAAYARAETVGIPELIREFDPVAVADKYINNTFKSIYYKEETAEMASFAKKLQRIGEKEAKQKGGVQQQALVDAEFLMTHLNKRFGREKGFMEMASPRISKVWKQVLSSKKLHMTEAEIKQRLTSPSTLSTVLTNMTYAGSMAKPTTSFRNFESMVTIVGPEIGGVAGREVAIESLLSMFLPTKKYPQPFGTYMEVRDRLLAEGRIPPKRVLTASPTQMSIESLTASKDLGARIRDGSAIATDAALSVFEWSEYVLRCATAESARKVIERAQRTGNARELLDGIVSPGVKDKIIGKTERLIEAQKELASATGLQKKNALRKEIETTKKEATDLYTDYLHQKTLYVYNDANKSAFLKDLGPMLNMFLRFPSENIGAMLNNVWAGKSGKMVDMILTPLATMGVFGGLYTSKVMEKGAPETEARATVYPGKGPYDMMTRTPGWLVGQAFKRDDRSRWQGIKSWLTPLPAEAYDFVKAIATVDDKAFMSFTRSALRNQTMGIYSFGEFLADDIVARTLLGEPDDTWKNAVKEIGDESVSPFFKLTREVLSDRWDSLKGLLGD